ncbi:MAG TPA: hypothetical protein VFJ05_02685 [Nitrososphaeraceae archaeon]|nr:hypothetical protein [Nitrososphaeraceae archaeon]
MSTNVSKKKNNRSKKKNKGKLGYFVSGQKNKLIKEKQTLRNDIRLRILQCLATKLSMGMSTSELVAAVPCREFDKRSKKISRTYR